MLNYLYGSSLPKCSKDNTPGHKCKSHDTIFAHFILSFAYFILSLPGLFREKRCMKYEKALPLFRKSPASKNKKNFNRL